MPSSPPGSRPLTLVRLVGVVTVVLLVPLVTTVVWGQLGEAWLGQWRGSPPSDGWIAGSLVAVLAADILLPVPSAPLITLAATQIGWLATWWWAWCGLTLGGWVAFGIARWGGPRLVQRLASDDDLHALRARADQNLPLLVLLTRPLPVVAEVAVLVVGLLGCRWMSVAWSLALGNCVVAGAFALLGAQATTGDGLAIAISVAIIAPLALTWWVRQKWLASPAISLVAEHSSDG